MSIVEPSIDERLDRQARQERRAATVALAAAQPVDVSPKFPETVSYVPALIASTAAVEEPKGAQGGPKPMPWQIEAREGRSQIGELRRGSTYIAEFARSVRWFPAVYDDDGQPVPLDTVVTEGDGDDAQSTPLLTANEQDLVRDVYDRLNDGLDGGMPTCAARSIENDLLVGEWYLIPVAWPATDTRAGYEEFIVASIFELGYHQGQWTVPTRDKRNVDGRATVKLPAGTRPIRMWTADPFYGAEADSPLKPLGTIMRQIIWQRLSTTSRMRSSIFAGMFAWPVEADSPTTGADGKTQTRPFTTAWLDWVQRGLKDPLSPINAAPLLTRAPMAMINAGKHYTFARPRGVDGPTAQELVREMLQAMDVPIELVLGLGETSTYAAAGLIMQDRFDGHLAPKLSAHAHHITDGWFRRDLRERGASEDLIARVCVWYDASDKIADPKRVENAQAAHSAMVISDQALRDALGFTPDDAPTPEELMRRRALTATTDGAIAEALWKLLDEEFVVKRGQVVGTDAIVTEQGTVVLEQPLDESASQGSSAPVTASLSAPPAPEATLLASAGLVTVSARLAALEALALTRLTDIGEAAMRRAGERIGARTFNRSKGQARVMLRGVAPLLVPSVAGRAMVAAAGVDDETIVAEEFQRERETVAAIVAAMLRDTTRIITAAARNNGTPPTDEEVDDTEAANDVQTTTAADWWVTGAATVAMVTLFHPGVAEGERAAGAFPTSVGRQTVAVGSGMDVGSVGAPGVVAGPLPGPVTSGSTGELARAVGMLGIGSIWRWGGAARPFEEHLDLDGTDYTADDRTIVLANPNAFPPFPEFFPGDHDGCTCTTETVLTFTASE